MDLVLNGLTWQICLLYLDDVLIYSRTFDEHIERVKLVLERIKGANLKLKPSKCKFCQHSVRFLGSIVSKEGVSPDPEKVRAVQEWPVPQNVTEVRSFTALAAYYRRFIRNFAAIARPLYDLTKKGQPFEWKAGQQNAFETLKERLTSAPVLVPPSDEGEFILDTDCSDFAAGAVLSQRQDGDVRVIAYASRVLNDAEKSYCTTRKELTAFIFGCKTFRHYLLLNRFLARVDHAALLALMKSRDPVGQAARWLDFLADYTFVLTHRNGISHGNADSLSRRPCERQTSDPCRQCEKKLPTVSEQFKEEKTQIRSIQIKRPGPSPFDLNTEIKQLELRAMKTRRQPAEAPLSAAVIAAAQDNEPDLWYIKTQLKRGVKPTWEEIASKAKGVQHYWAQ